MKKIITAKTAADLRRDLIRAIEILDRAQDGLLRDDRAGNTDNGESDAQPTATRFQDSVKTEELRDNLIREM
jgi:hypothetical protein